MTWFFFYNYVALPALWLLLRIASAFDEKVRRGVAGRRDLFARLSEKVENLPRGHKRVWFHASSLGEFESAKPIITAMKKRYAALDIIVSFFSPSGFEHSKAYKAANIITYIPFDTPSNARKFIDCIRPDLAVVVRYDLWPNHVRQLKRRGIPTFIANATISEDTSQRFPLVRGLHRVLYSLVDGVFTVSPSDRERFLRLFPLAQPTVEVVGDTRYDQVWMRSRDAKGRHVLPARVVRGKQILVVGSSWEQDERLMLRVFLALQSKLRDLLMIIVPHEPTIENLDRLESELNGNTSVIRFSDLNDYRGERVILVDSVGILLSLYSYADVAIVGGGFRQGVHNVLEPAAYGVPVLFGPKHMNSREALLLVERGGAIVIENQETLFDALQSLLQFAKRRRSVGRHALEVVKENLGATERLLGHLDRHIRTPS